MKYTVLIFTILFSLNSILGQEVDANRIDSSLHIIDMHDVDEIAIFPGCDRLEGKHKIRCSYESLEAYIDNIKKIPVQARSLGLKEKCSVAYTITKEGNMKDVELIHDIGHGCGDEALRVMKLIAEEVTHWQPAIKGGKTVAVRMRTAISFLPKSPLKFVPINRNDSKKKESNNAVKLSPSSM